MDWQGKGSELRGEQAQVRGLTSPSFEEVRFSMGKKNKKRKF
jgi:hypothetical protein